ncbi:MAG: DUF3429 domain-containing protein [Parvibaculaceae bacterium]
MREHRSIPRPALAAGILALLPFPALLILIWTAPAGASREWFISVFLSYMAAVLALMGGAYWALATGPYGNARIAAEWLTGLACLVIAWAGINVPAHLGMTMLIAAFFLLALRDVVLAEAEAIPLWFGRMRSYIAAVVIVTAILALVRILT